MEERRKDLISTQQRKIVNAVVAVLNESHPSFYYLSTIEIAAEIKKYIHEPGKLGHDDLQLVKDLKRHDIQMLLSLHSV
jgi:hypothetical protein